MKVAGYVRVSSEEQARTGQSLEAQAEKVRLFCRLHDLELIDVIEDAGVSAKSLRRPGVARALALLRSGEAQGLVIAKLDRLSRSVRDWSGLIEEHFSERAGRMLFSVSDSVDTRTAAGRLVLNVLASVFQWEREAVGERTRDVLRYKRSRGEAVSRAPRGLRIEGKYLVPDQDTAALAAVHRAAALRARGLTFQAVAEQLNREGFKPERGALIRQSTVHGWLSNPHLAEAIGQS